MAFGHAFRTELPCSHQRNERLPVGAHDSVSCFLFVSSWCLFFKKRPKDWYHNETKAFQEGWTLHLMFGSLFPLLLLLLLPCLVVPSSSAAFCQGPAPFVIASGLPGMNGALGPQVACKDPIIGPKRWFTIGDLPSPPSRPLNPCPARAKPGQSLDDSLVKGFPNSPPRDAPALVVVAWNEGLGPSRLRMGFFGWKRWRS